MWVYTHMCMNENPTKNDSLFVHSRHTHFSFFHSNNTFISIKKITAHTQTVRYKYSEKHTRTQIAHMSIYAKWWNIHELQVLYDFFTPWNFILVSNAWAITEIFIRLSFYLKKEEEIRSFLRFESNFIDSVSIWCWDGWKHSSIRIVFPMNLPNVCHIYVECL